MLRERTETSIAVTPDASYESLKETKPNITQVLHSIKTNLKEAAQKTQTLEGVDYVGLGSALASGGWIYFGGSPGFSLVLAAAALGLETANVFFWKPKNRREVEYLAAQLSKFNK